MSSRRSARAAQVNFIARTRLLNFLRENGEVGLRVAQQLGETYRYCHR